MLNYRKLILVLVALICVTVLGIFTKVEIEKILTAVEWLVTTYVAGNVVAKFAPPTIKQ